MGLKKMLVAVAVLATAQTAGAQEYFDFGSIPGAPAQPAVQIDLNPMMLGLFGGLAQTDNPEAAALLSSIDGVRLRMYRALENTDTVVQFIDEVAARLASENWQQVVSVQDEANVRVHIRGDEETMTGVTAMIVHEQDAVFVNLVGSIQSSELARMISDMQSGESLAALAPFMSLAQFPIAFNETP